MNLKLCKTLYSLDREAGDRILAHAKRVLSKEPSVTELIIGGVLFMVSVDTEETYTLNMWSRPNSVAWCTYRDEVTAITR